MDDRHLWVATYCGHCAHLGYGPDGHPESCDEPDVGTGWARYTYPRPHWTELAACDEHLALLASRVARGGR